MVGGSGIRETVGLPRAAVYSRCRRPRPRRQWPTVYHQCICQKEAHIHLC